MTNWTPRTITVPLNFLKSGQTYAAQIYEDAADAAEHPTHVTIRRQRVHLGDTLKIHLAPGRGCAIRFTPDTAHSAESLHSTG